MARLPHDTSAGQSDSSAHTNTTVLDANSGHSLTLPGHEYITDAQMLRDGQDLILHPAHGNDVVVKNYFTADPAPTLTSADGGTALTHDLVDSFVKPIGGIQYAQNGSMYDSSPVGIVKEASGDGTITHANGTVQKAAIGVPIYEGDIVETKAHGAVNITFVDKTTFAVSENAKMAIDQYVFDPATQHGENNFSVLRGVFVFTSGLIGHADPDDVKINTPVGSIGIRGTTIMGTINPGGDSHVSVVEGAIVVSNASGETTLSQQFETVKLNGMNQPMTSEGVLPAETMANNYNVLRTVSGPLFSTFDDMGKSNDQSDQNGGSAPAEDAAPATDEAPVKSAAPDSVAPIEKSDAADPAASDAPVTLTQITLDDTKASLDTGFDTSAGLKTTSTFSSDAGVTAATTASTTISTSPVTTAVSANTFSAPSVPITPSTGTIATTTPNVSNTATATNALPALTLSLALVTNPGLTSGSVVATITASIMTGVAFNWTSPNDGSGNPLFNLTSNGNGTATITLTTFGSAYVNGLVNGSDILYAVNATLPDGRTASVNGDLLVPADYDLSLNNVITGGVANAGFIPSIAGESQHGYSLTALGDYNHDGRADYAFANNLAVNGNLFIDDKLGNHFNLNLGAAPYNLSSTDKLTLASAGDFNGDGKGDLIIGSYLADDVAQFSSGKVFILTNPATGAGVDITGFSTGQMAGFSVSGIGDYNGDGYNDILVGAPYTSGTGSAYMLLGRAGNGSIDVSNLTTEGFAITGAAGTAANVSGIGDFNHDGYSDFAVTDMSANRVSFYYGNGSGTNTGAVNIVGLNTGATPKIVSLGDGNGDGSTDFGIFDNLADKFYVFNGGASRSNTGFAVSSANYTFTSASGSIINVESAGDFNGDGINDTALAIRNGSNIDIYVVYGGPSLTGTLDPEGMTNTYQMHIDLTSSQFNLVNPTTDLIKISLSTAGDLNGDGYDDLLIGLPNVDSNGGLHSNDGGLIIVSGGASAGGITSGLIANASYQSLVGTNGADTMSNGSAANTNVHLNSGAGNDSLTIFGSFGASLIDGGTGIDTLHLNGGSIDLRNASLSNLENIALDAPGAVLTLTLDQVFNLLHTSENNTLHIDTSAASTQFNIDTNKTGSTMTAAGFTDAGISGNYHMYAQGQYTLYVDTTITTVAANI